MKRLTIGILILFGAVMFLALGQAASANKRHAHQWDGQCNEPLGPPTFKVKTCPTPSPEPSPEPTPKSTPQTTPEATPEATPKVTPEATPEASPTSQLTMPRTLPSVGAHGSDRNHR